MNIVFGFPPNYGAIRKVFDVRGRPVLFCWGDKIFNPLRAVVGPELIAHESVHSRRQGADPASWWDRYLIDRRFRLNEEIPAHIAEVAVSGDARSAAKRLSGALYGGLISYADALGVLGDGGRGGTF